MLIDAPSEINASVVDRVFGGSLIYIATTPLAAPVGRATCGDALCHGSETLETCPLDCASEPEPPPEDSADGGGCSTGGGAGLLFAVALLGVRRRRAGAC